MSRRKVKLLLEMHKENQAKPQLEESSEEEEEEEELQVKPKQAISFATFGQSSSEEETPEEIEAQKQKEEETTKQIEVKKKKKSKRKRNKNKNKDNQEDDEEKREVEEVKKALKDLNFVSDPTQNNKEENEEWAYILDINEGNFNYKKEMRRHFRGWEPEKNEDDPERSKKQQKMQKHLRKMMKKSVLSPGITEYFPIREKFDIQREDNAVTFEASKKYVSIQKEYDIVRNSNDVNALFEFSQLNPEHVDSIYAIGQFLRLQGNYREADTLIQKVIYIYEMSGGHDLLEFVKEPFLKKYIVYDQFSTSFFMSIFKFIDILGKKGCFRTALEYNKFLLKINVNDPTACLLSIDYNAISGRQYSYLLDFAKDFSSYIGASHTSLYLLPNFCYSVALAKMLEYSDPKKQSQLLVQENNLAKYLDFTQDHWNKALILPSDNSFVEEDPRILILRAIMVYPKLIIDIAAKNQFAKQYLNHQTFTGWQKKPFQQILSHEFWTYVPESYSYYFLKLETIEDSQGLDKVLEVYVERSKILWKSNNVMLWVKGALGMVLNKIDDKFNYQEHLQTLCLEETQSIAIPFSLARYAKINKNNFSDRVERVDLNNIQDNQQQMGPPQGQQLNMNQNPFSLFLNSLLPWVNIPGAQQQQFDPNMPFIEEDDV